MPIGYNVGQQALSLHSAFERLQYGKIQAQTEKTEAYTQDLKDIVELIQRLHRDQNDAGVDYTQNPEAHDLIDKIRRIAPELMADGQYKWDKNEVENLLESLRYEPNRIQQLINQTMNRLTQSFQERNQITQITSDILKAVEEEVRKFIYNQIQR